MVLVMIWEMTMMTTMKEVEARDDPCSTVPIPVCSSIARDLPLGAYRRVCGEIRVDIGSLVSYSVVADVHNIRPIHSVPSVAA